MLCINLNVSTIWLGTEDYFAVNYSDFAPIFSVQNKVNDMKIGAINIKLKLQIYLLTG